MYVLELKILKYTVKSEQSSMKETQKGKVSVVLSKI
jgi:hypothetical protein